MDFDAQTRMGLAVVVGIIAGAAAGVLLENIALWLAVGVGAGAALGVMWSRQGPNTGGDG